MPTKILLADHAELIAALEKVLFRRKSFHLMVAGDGEQAWQMVEREEPDLVFLDLHMPGLAGDLCCRRIKDDPRHEELPVVLLASTRPEDLDRCRQAGCDAVLSRPIQRLRLAALVRRLLRLPARYEPRRQISLRIHYGTEMCRLLTARTLNLATGGALIQAPLVLPVETPMHLEIFLPGVWPPICCQGRVAWLSAPGRNGMGEMGVEFLGLAAADKDAIRSFLEQEGLAASA